MKYTPTYLVHSLNHSSIYTLLCISYALSANAASAFFPLSTAFEVKLALFNGIFVWYVVALSQKKYKNEWQKSFCGANVRQMCFQLPIEACNWKFELTVFKRKSHLSLSSLYQFKVCLLLILIKQWVANCCKSYGKKLKLYSISHDFIDEGNEHYECNQLGISVFYEFLLLLLLVSLLLLLLLFYVICWQWHVLHANYVH